MNYEDIKKLIDDMGNSKIDELQIEFPEGMKISMKKDKTQEVVVASKPVATVEQKTTVTIPKEENTVEDCKCITSPMVGTFYNSASPKDEPYVKIGDKVHKGQVLCIVEAMKLMNEIESDYDGEIVEICVNNEDMVDFGKVLFKIK